MTNLDHSRFMRRALAMALKGEGRVGSNPLVGCVIVKSGRIVSEGYHKKFGGDHAEISALRKAGTRARGATMYINLEPCSHWGKTPPCAPEIIKAGIKEVFAAIRDPNPQVFGRGIRLLQEARIKVHLGLEKKAAESLNHSFLISMVKKRPFVTLKMAMSLDGKIATASGDSKWISSPPSRRHVHQLRAGADAIIIGATTAIQDNPSLTSHGAGRNPLRVILDPRLKTPVSLQVYNDQKAKTLVITSAQSSQTKAKQLMKRDVQILRVSLKFNRFDLASVLKTLFKMHVNQLIVEGGGETSWSFVRGRLVDRILLFVAPLLIGGKDSRTSLEGEGVRFIRQAFQVKSLAVSRFGPDLLIDGRLT